MKDYFLGYKCLNRTIKKIDYDKKISKKRILGLYNL